MIDFLKRTAKSALGAVAPIQSQIAGIASSFGAAANAQKKASDQKAKTAAASTVAASPNIVKPIGPIRPPVSATENYGSSSMFEVPSIKSSGVTTKPGIVVQAPAKPTVNRVQPATPQSNGFTSTNPDVTRQVQAMQNSASGSSTMPSTLLSSFNAPAQRQSSPSTVAASPSVPTSNQSVSAPMQTQTSAATKINEQLKALRDTLLSTYATTPQEQQAREALQNIIAQQANLAASEQSGLAEIANQPIVLGLIRGQEQALQRQAATQQGALSAQAVPLEAQIANLQAERERQRAMAEKQLGFTESDLAREEKMASGNAPIEIGGALVQLNPETGRYEEVYRGAGEGAEGFTLSEGQMRYDAQGNLIASGGQKQTSKPATIEEYEYARSQGFQGGFLDYQRAKESLGAELSLSGAQISDALSKGYKSKEDMAQYARMVADGITPPAADRSLSVEQSKARQFAMSADQANKVLDQINYNPGFIEFEGLPNQLKGEKRQQFEQASRAFVNSVLRRESGATITDDEFNNKYLELIPRAGDSQAVKDQKAIARATAVKSIQEAGFIDPSGAVGGGDALDQALAQMGFKNAMSSAQKGSTSGLGKLSSRYESGGNPGAIGYDNTGGWSYGTYQLAHNNAKSFISQSPYGQFFEGLAFNSPQFRQRWQEVAKADPQGFADAQHSYIEKTHFAPQAAKLASLGLDVEDLSPALKDVIWSTSVQHGPATKIIENALRSLPSTATEQDLIKKIYELRWSGGSSFARSTPDVQKGVYNRFFAKGGELDQALAMSAAYA